MVDALRLQGLVAATHTPFTADGALNLAVVERQAAHLLKHGVQTAFIGGTTGESSSLTVVERLSLAQRWMEVVRGSQLQVVVHVGANCLEEARALAAQAQELGALAVSALSPSYFKPKDATTLAECMGAIASAAPGLPFYYYEIPSMTGVTISPSAFLEAAAERIPNLAGIKFTSNNLVEFQLCRAFQEGRFDILFGFDEMLLAALALGAKGAVGSTYNFSAPIYHELRVAFEAGDLVTARDRQLQSVRLVQVLAAYGFFGAAKATMELLGVPVGRPRLPHMALSESQRKELAQQLAAFGVL